MLRAAAAAGLSLGGAESSGPGGGGTGSTAASTGGGGPSPAPRYLGGPHFPSGFLLAGRGKSIPGRVVLLSFREERVSQVDSEAHPAGRARVCRAGRPSQVGQGRCAVEASHKLPRKPPAFVRDKASTLESESGSSLVFVFGPSCEW